MGGRTSDAPLVPYSDLSAMKKLHRARGATHAAGNTASNAAWLFYPCPLAPLVEKCLHCSSILVRGGVKDIFPHDSHVELCGFLRQLMKSERFLWGKSAAMLTLPNCQRMPSNKYKKQRKKSFLTVVRILQLFFPPVRIVCPFSAWPVS